MNKHQTFSVNVTISDVTDLYSYQFELYYNTTILNCTGVGLPPNHFLKPINSGNICIVKQEYDNTYNATHGRVWVAIALMGEEPGKNGSGTLATINFKATEFGTSTLHLYDVIIGNTSAQAMPVILVDGSVTVLPSLTVLAVDQCGNNLTTWYVRLDGQPAGLTGSTFTVSAGTHEVFVGVFWESGGTGYRYGFTHWENDSTDNPRTITVVEDTTITAYFKKKWCPGDVDGDVDFDDYVLFIGYYPTGVVDVDSAKADLDGDGDVDQDDYVILVGNYGNQYPDP